MSLIRAKGRGSRPRDAASSLDGLWGDSFLSVKGGACTKQETDDGESSRNLGSSSHRTPKKGVPAWNVNRGTRNGVVRFANCRDTSTLRQDWGGGY